MAKKGEVKASEAEEVVDAPEVEEAEEEVEVKAPEAKAKKVAKSSITVQWKGRERTYSQAVHGDDFADLADEFCAKHGAVVVE